MMSSSSSSKIDDSPIPMTVDDAIATGIKLGNESEGSEYTHHRNLGITFVALATLQVLALFLHSKTDHKHRLKWSVYHRVIGYVVIILSIVNVFKGFGILVVSADRRAYVGVLIALAVVVTVLEVFTWVVVIRRRKMEEKEKVARNGYGRQQA